MRAPFGLLACALTLLPTAVRGDPPALARKALTVLETHCHRCHGRNGSAKGGLGYVLDREKLIARGKVVPGNASESELYLRVASGEMPPRGNGPRPGKADLLALRQWIAAGAPGTTTAVPRRSFVSAAELQRAILDDLEAVNPRHRRFVRYLTLTHLANQGLTAKELELTRQAVSKLVNALSWHPRVTPPTPCGPGGTVLRLDLRHYRWTAALWDRVVAAYPYRFGTGTAEARTIALAAGTDLAYLRADWFVATASRPPLYHDLLQLPTTERGLERLLQVDVPTALREETAVRVGFNDSGVSRNNRLLERHDAAFGAYWRSYDFAANTGRQNLFEHPLGPAAGETSFQHAGGEMIFHLPNGLQGYMLTDGLGRRIDSGPVEIVSDPKRPDQRVVAGLSCLNCHASGLLPKADQVRAHVEKNLAAFARAAVETVRALYPAKGKVQALLAEDNRRYLQALARTGALPDAPEPINAVTQRYEATLDLKAAAAELGLSAGNFATRLEQTPVLLRLMGALRAAAGTVQRQVVEEGFAEIVRTLRLNEPFTVKTDSPGSVLAPFAGHTGAVLDVAFAPDGARVASASGDRTVRLWDSAAGKELRRFAGHTDEVTCVAFTPDGRWVVSGSRDRTVRVWDADTGREVSHFTGHTDRVRAVAVSPDGTRVASAGDDAVVRIWDLTTGAAAGTLAGHTRPVRALAFGPDGRKLLSAGQDGTVRLWDIAARREVVRLEGHTRAVYAVAFSPDGRRVLSGGEDRTVRLWNLAAGKEQCTLEGHANAVIRVAFSRDGRGALSGSSQYQAPDRVLRRWDLGAGTEVRALAGPEGLAIGCLAFSPDGRSAVVGGPDRTLRLLQLAR